MGKATVAEFSKTRAGSKEVIEGSSPRQGRIADQFLGFRWSLDLLKPLGSNESGRKITGV
jgi:hypothetical protein